jgi:aromatic ring hydroxylase
VLVPWDRVFVYRDPGRAQRYHQTVLLWAAWVSTVRLLTKLRFSVGVAQLLCEWSGREPRTLLGRLLQDVEILRACLIAAEAEGYRKPSGLWAPRLNEAHRLHGIEASDRAEQLLEQILTSTLIQTGGASDLSVPEIGPLVERYFRGGAPSTRDHLRLLAVASDLVQTAFANRNQLYERLWGGDPEAIRQRLHRNTDLSRFTGPVLCFIRDRW